MPDRQALFQPQVEPFGKRGVQILAEQNSFGEQSASIRQSPSQVVPEQSTAPQSWRNSTGQ
jgi:hypothetical protein